MYFALGAAASTAADLLQSLVPGKSSTSKATTGLTQNTTTAFDVSSTTITPANALPSSGSTSQSGALAPQTLSALFAASQSSSSSPTSQSDALKDLFGQLDTNGDGQISKSEFETQLGAGGTNVANADSVFGKLDANGDGSVSLDELTSALSAKKGGSHGGHHHAHGAGGGGGKGGQDALMQALDGASGTSTTNSDGSTSTTVTYADGSTVTMTTPAAAKSSTSNSASSTYNLVEQMIQKQATALATSAQQSLSVSV